jgi:hypothetical protein
MSTKKGTRKKGAQVKPGGDAELEAFAHHLAEVLRIARTHPDIPSQLYNDIAEGWTEFVNRTPRGGPIADSEPMIKLGLFGGIEQRRAERGGAK